MHTRPGIQRQRPGSGTRPANTAPAAAFALVAGLHPRIRSGALSLRGLVGLALAGLAGFGAYQAQKYPMINDITTTPEAAPQFRKIALLPEHKDRDLSYPASFAALQTKAYPDLAPLSLAADPARALACIRETASRRTGWTIVSVDPAAGVVEAVAITPLMRFADDVVIEVRAASGKPGSVVHMRSRSRLGKGDFGANAQRIREFLAGVRAGCS